MPFIKKIKETDIDYINEDLSFLDEATSKASKSKKHSPRDDDIVAAIDKKANKLVPEEYPELMNDTETFTGNFDDEISLSEDNGNVHNFANSHHRFFDKKDNISNLINKKTKFISHYLIGVLFFLVSFPLLYLIINGDIMVKGFISFFAAIAFSFFVGLVVILNYKRIESKSSVLNDIYNSRIKNINILGIGEKNIEAIFNLLESNNTARVITDKDFNVKYANDSYVNLCKYAKLPEASEIASPPDYLLSHASFGKASQKKLYNFYKETSGKKCYKIFLPLKIYLPEDVLHLKNFNLRSRFLENNLNVENKMVFEISTNVITNDLIVWDISYFNLANNQYTSYYQYNNLPFSIIQIDQDGLVLYANQEAIRNYNLEAGNNITDFILDDEIIDNPEVLFNLDSDIVNATIKKLGVDDYLKIQFKLLHINKSNTSLLNRFLLISNIDQLNVGENQYNSSIIEYLPFPCAIFTIDEKNANHDFSSPSFKELLGNNEISYTNLLKEHDIKYSKEYKNKLIKTGEFSKNNKFYEVYYTQISKSNSHSNLLILYFIDVTNLKQLKEDKEQDQKLKAIGQLAGGIAHDFNNILQILMGSTELLLRSHPIGDPSYMDLNEIKQSTQRAANLTKKLLAFSRTQTLRNKRVSVSGLINDLSKFLSRTLTEKVKLVVHHGKNVPDIFVDETQLEVVLMNLAVNARDAMDSNGVFTLHTEYVDDDLRRYLDYGELDKNKKYVLIEAFDTGNGISPEIKDKIFDPYFTTKAIGKGTGLGLATVYGIINQFGGAIYLADEPLAFDESKFGKFQGAVFHILLPVFDPAIHQVEAKQNIKKNSGKKVDAYGSGKLLVVEDEDAVRQFVIRALENCGYEVDSAIDATDGEEKIRSDTKYDLILSDIMMPDKDGTTMIQDNLSYLGDTALIFMSGYAENEMREKLENFSHAGYIQKPFPMKKIAELIKVKLSERVSATN